MTQKWILASLVLSFIGGHLPLRTFCQAAVESATSNSLALPGATPPGTNPATRIIPALPGAKTAADTFRELLAMTPAERTVALASRSEFNRKYLENRLRDYEALSPDERELRLKQLELNCHLPDLMKLAPTNRAQRLASVPANLKPLVEARLKQWDLLPTDVQHEVLDHQTTANFFLQVRPGPVSQPEGNLASTFPPLPGEDKPSGNLESFNRFFELPTREQEKTLDVLPAKEREEMEKTLQVFAKLPPAQRQACIDSFLRFRRLTKDQRDQFLKNAERWKGMSPAERETWRTLVKILPSAPTASNVPPLPRGLEPLNPTTASNQSGLRFGEK